MSRTTIQYAILISLLHFTAACTLYDGGSDDGYNDDNWDTYPPDARTWTPDAWVQDDASNPWPDAAPWIQDDAATPWPDAGTWTEDAGTWTEDAGTWTEDAAVGNGCEFIAQEAICVVTAGCQPQYDGVNCSCDMVSCQCERFEFQSCE